MLEQLLVIVSITSLVMVIPGPDMVLVLRNTFLSGRRSGLLTSLGVLAGNLVHITYCVLGIGLLISKSIIAFATLKYAAAAYLVYLGVISLRSGPRPLDLPEAAAWRSTGSWFIQGFINNILNPKGTLFYLGVFTVVITPGTKAGAMVVLVSTMLLVSASFWVMFVCVLDRPAVRGVIERFQTAATRVFGGLLILLGVRVAFAQR